jgi:hypothetical protein
LSDMSLVAERNWPPPLLIRKSSLPNVLNTEETADLHRIHDDRIHILMKRIRLNSMLNLLHFILIANVTPKAIGIKCKFVIKLFHANSKMLPFNLSYAG